MQSGADGALFGNDAYVANGYQDIWFGGIGIITEDGAQDVTGAIIIDSSNQVTAELKKPLNSGDTSGKDTSWAKENTYTMVVIWDSNGGGSSGSRFDHSGVPPKDQTIFIDSNVIPEFPGLIFTALFLP